MFSVCPQGGRTPTTNDTWWMDLKLQGAPPTTNHTCLMDLVLWEHVSLLLMTPGGLDQHYNRRNGFHFTKLIHVYCLKLWIIYI